MVAAKHIRSGSWSAVTVVAFADESQVVGGHDNGEIRRWKIEDGHQLGQTMRGSGDIRSIAVSQDGRWIVSGDDGRKATVWNAATHERVLDTEHNDYVYAIDISNDCTKCVAASYGTANNVQLFDITASTSTAGTPLLPPLSHRKVDGVKFSPDGSRFATVSYDSGFRIYSTHDSNVLFDSGTQGSTNSSSSLVTPLAWSSDGQQLFVANRGKITCFDVSNSSSSEWSIRETRSDASIASNGSFIACSAGKSVSLWDCVSHKQIGSIITHKTEIRCIALSPSGRYLACGVGKNITIHNLGDILPWKYTVNVLPLVQVSNKTLVSWTQGDATNTEMLLSEEIASISSPSHYLLASRALVRARLKHVALAIEDGKESLRLQPSPIGYIAMAVSLLIRGDRECALCTFDLAFHDCEPHEHRLLLVLKSILVFESGNRDVAVTCVEHLIIRASDVNDKDAIYLYIQVLAVMNMKKGNYERAMSLIERAKNLGSNVKRCLPVVTISLIFGWNFSKPDIASQQRLCETLYAEGRTTEVVEILLSIVRTSDEETKESKATAAWIADFAQKCTATLEHVGDEALISGGYDDAIAQYSTAFCLSPPSPVGLFIKRSRARAAKGLWEDAVQDANKVVEADPSNPWGYEAKHAALHGAQRYDEAIDSFDTMLRAIEQSHDPNIRQLRGNYISPSQVKAAIDSIAREILRHCPLVVIDATTGYLCDGRERIRIFEADPSSKELISSMTRKVDSERIRQVVDSFFRYVMFSHVWQGKESSLLDVGVVKTVWNLPQTPLNEKLHNFCKETCRLGYKWAWSDTCCIDKTTNSILNQSIMSMYKWYADSAATLVFLADVAHPSKPGDLKRSLWMTRAWTLQELLAPRVIFFYDSEWKSYLGNTGDNHKKSPNIMEELADAMKIPHKAITFSLGGLAVREKLRLASTRNATVEEDVAYSLIGIFKSNLRPRYGEGADALGRLLKEIVARFADVTVLAWSGKSSSYNSCLPASISVYNQTPYTHPPLEGGEMETYITSLRGKLSLEGARSICRQINSLPAAHFAARRLYLPCIFFPVRRLDEQERHSGNEKVYHAKVSGLGNVEFTTTDDLEPGQQKTLVFAHPWICYIRAPNSWVTRENDFESDAGADSDTDGDPGSDTDGDPGSDEVAPYFVAATFAAGRYTRMLQMIARLAQPFNALLLARQPGGHYKRIATENEIVVPGLGTNITPQNIRTTVLEIL